MKKKLKLQIILFISSFLLFSGCIAPEEPSIEFTGISINKEKMFSTMSDAIDAAKDNDVIWVGEGIYNETLEINKTISIIGSGANSTIFDVNAENPSPVFAINADYCIIKNISIKNSYPYEDDVGFAMAIKIKSSHNVIEYISIQNFSFGIQIENQDYNYINYTNIVAKSVGIEILNANYNKIINCSVSNCHEFGVFIGIKSMYNHVYDSFFYNCDNGIRLKDAQKNTIYRNTLRECRTGIYECCGAEENGIFFNIEE